MGGVLASSIIFLPLVLAIALIVASPILVVVSGVWHDGAGELWQHLLSTVFADYVLNSLWLFLGVGAGVLGVGTAAAWLVTACAFPGRRLWEWLLILPLAAPSYILAYVYTELLEYYGPVQTQGRQWFGWSSVNDYWFPPIRSLGGAIAMFVLVLYPYVYLLARTAFLEQSTCTLEASRSLGCTPWRSFFRVALPLARPNIIAGCALALMETLNDYGTVQFFGVDTFTVGIYRTWFGFDERPAAVKLAAILTLGALLLIALEQWSRRQAKFYQKGGRCRTLSRHRLGGWRGYGATIFCGLLVLLGFGVPVAELLYLCFQNAVTNFGEDFWRLSWHSFSLAVLSALLGMVLAMVLAYGQRLSGTWGVALSVRIAAMGYAIPGAVIAVGIMQPLGYVDQVLGTATGGQLLLSGSILALIFAYTVRFLAVSLGTVEASLTKIKPDLDEAARSLGHPIGSILIRIHAPLMTGGMLSASLLLFVDVMKELPATIVMRPFNFETLAVRVYEYAADERLAEAAAPALAILLVGMVPVILLSWQLGRSRATEVEKIS
ncbi:MAG: iron ABC transporter permease [Oscillatoriales cyanobacterium SM2_2_1]|nr:iron ABC transporter permease [Oscillatoriales cyanobacterium SM2_2_1]